MKAIVLRELGGPKQLRYEDVPDPEPGPGEVRLKVSAVGLNFFDTLIIVDRYQFKPERPFSPGAECAGVIDAVGEGVSDWRIGERVAAFLGFGACRERVVAPASRLVRVPDGVSDEQAAGLSVTYGTGLHALKDRADLKAGETLACSAPPAARGSPPSSSAG